MQGNNQRGWFRFFLCPKCLRLLETWYDFCCAKEVYYTERIDTDNEVEEIFDYDVSGTVEYCGSQCPECGESFEFRGEYILIEISRNFNVRVVDPQYSYWTEDEARKRQFTRLKNRIIEQFIKMREKNGRE